jgi:hypothetical protein
VSARSWLKCILCGMACLQPAAAAGQGYRLRLDSRFQSVAFRGLTPDSIPVALAVVGPSGGFETPDGFAVHCAPGNAFCTFFRPGPRLDSSPLVTSADVTIWGLGVRGLSIRGNTRWGVDLGSDDFWPGTRPEVQLVEGYAEYATEVVTGRLGRQQVTGRLGWHGFDGADVTLRWPRLGLEGSAYGGWGLARGTNVPTHSPALNPLNEFQLSERAIVAGGEVGWRSRNVDLRAEYRREVDPAADLFIAERTALTALFYPAAHVILSGGAEYDLAQGWWGSSDLSLRYNASRVSAEAGIRRYRPFFELWTIWGAFSPVPYSSVNGSVAVGPLRWLHVRISGERYWYDDSGAETGLATFVEDGWRWSLGATVPLDSTLTIDGGYHAEFGPGASSHTWDGRVTWLPVPQVSLALFGSTLTRPLEFRFYEARVDALGIDAEYRPSETLRLTVSGGQYFEDRQRPDAGAFDWNQFRVQAGVTWLFGSDADRIRLPRALRRPGRRPAR